MAGQPVAGAARYDSKRGWRMDNGACYFVHCPVTADGHYNIDAFGRRAAGQFGRMTGIFGLDDGIIECPFVNEALNVVRDVAFSRGSGDRIDNEKYILLHEWMQK